MADNGSSYNSVSTTSIWKNMNHCFKLWMKVTCLLQLWFHFAILVVIFLPWGWSLINLIFLSAKVLRKKLWIINFVTKLIPIFMVAKKLQITFKTLIWCSSLTTMKIVSFKYLDDELKEERKVQTINPFRAQASKKDSFLYFETICVYGLRIKNA